jgi:hypothetical protein
MYLQFASVRTKLFSRSQSKTVKLLQIVIVRDGCKEFIQAEEWILLE